MYNEQILEYFDMTKCKPVSILLRTTLTMNNCPSSPEEINEINNISYHIVFGLLM